MIELVTTSYHLWNKEWLEKEQLIFLSMRAIGKKVSCKAVHDDKVKIKLAASRAAQIFSIQESGKRSHAAALKKV